MDQIASHPFVQALGDVSAQEVLGVAQALVASAANVIIFCVAFSSELYCDLVLKLAGFTIWAIDTVTGARHFGASPKPHAQRRACEPVYEDGNPNCLDEAKTLERSSYPHAPATLIKRTKEVLASMYKDPELLADDFQFTAPIVGPLPKKRFLALWKEADVTSAFPGMKTNAFGFTVDPMEPDRVWFFHRTQMVFTGELKVFGGPFPIKGDNTNIVTPPQAQSMRFDKDLKVYALTVGAVVDRCAANNCGGLGGMFGPLVAIGRGLPFPEGRPLEQQRSLRFEAGMRLGQTVDAVLGLAIVRRIRLSQATKKPKATTKLQVEGGEKGDAVNDGHREGEVAVSAGAYTPGGLQKAVASPVPTVASKTPAQVLGVNESTETKG